jgi:hypothetical protein
MTQHEHREALRIAIRARLWLDDFVTLLEGEVQ